MKRRNRALVDRGFAIGLLALSVLLSSSQASSAATLFMTTAPGFHGRVGDPIGMSFAIQLGADEGPGTLDIVLDWGRERALYAPYQLGALVLVETPSVSTSDPFLTVHLSENCSQGVNAVAGACTLRASSSQPVPAGLHAVATLQFRYLWVPALGYEICTVRASDPACVPAGQQVLFFGEGTDFSGEPIIGIVYSASTFGSPGVRPIPEPGAATSIALGLLLLARRSRSGRSMARRSHVSKRADRTHELVRHPR